MDENKILEATNKFRENYLGLLNESIIVIEKKLDIFSEQLGNSDSETVAKSIATKVRQEMLSLKALVKFLKYEGPAKAIILIPSKGKAVDLLNGARLNEEQTYNQIFDNINPNN